MKSPLEVLNDLGAPTHSYIRTVQFFSEKEWTHKQYERTIAKILGVPKIPPFDTNKEARLYFLYLTQETVKAFLGQDVPDMDVVWDKAVNDAKIFITDHPWCVMDYTSNTDGETPSKGAKKDRAQELYLSMNDGTHDRHAVIQALIDEVEMTKAGATTYFHNLREQYGFAGPLNKKTPKKRITTSKPIVKPKEKRESKGIIAKRVYETMAGSPKEEIIVAIMQQANTSKAGANTYYCKWKKELSLE